MTSASKRIAVIPGDGIGPEVMEEAVGVLERVRETHGVELELKHFDWGADKFLSEGVSLPEGALEMLATRVRRRSSQARSATRACRRTSTPKTSCSGCGAASTSTSTCAPSVCSTSA